MNIIRKNLCIALVILLVLISSDSCYAREYSSGELLEMTKQSLSYNSANNTAYVKGVGRIVQNNAQGILLARRAALTDARRGLLILKKQLESGKKNKNFAQVSGHVPELRILSESQQGNLYFIEVEAALSELLRNKYYTYIIIKL